MHALSCSLNVFFLDSNVEPIVINVVDHPRSACWRDENTVIVSEHKELSQFYLSSGHSFTAFNRVNVGTQDISSLFAFTSSDNVVACTATDRGVFGLNSRDLKIVKRWRAPIRNTILGCVGEETQSSVLGCKVEVVYMCGDDNEVLMFKSSGKEEKEGALKERHSINIRSRSRVIGLSLLHQDGMSLLCILGQNGDLDIVQKPCDYLMERRKRKLQGGEDTEEKRLMMEE